MFMARGSYAVRGTAAQVINHIGPRRGRALYLCGLCNTVLNSYTLCVVQSVDVVEEDSDLLNDAALCAGVFRLDGGANLAGDGFARRHNE